MQVMCQVLVALVCALGVSPVLAVPYGGNKALGRLELEPYEHGAMLHRTRRQAFPGAGMPCLTVTFLTEMKGRFSDRIDPNDDGKATFKEVKSYLSNFNPAVSDAQVSGFITRRDLNGNGRIEFIPEYILDIATPDMTPEAAAEWFSLEDGDADGYVTRRELMRIAQHLGMTPQQADASVSSYYMSVDTDDDDRLSFDEYKVLYGQ
ncbi:hypothetical protein V1264_010569 [Littorina saxatilis]|uniref:EF-hand domain-containing protein n=2 Tax=Littorina saxatilis TaxID=31220 RepID=A0AAN9APP0_9CAEN